MKHRDFEVPSVLIKVQILGRQRLLVFKKSSESQSLFLYGRGICQKGYMSEEVYLANKT